MKKRSKRKNILILVVLILGIIQFIPVDRTSKAIDASKDFIAIHKPPAGVEKMLRTACYDCHSNETTYPWYAHVAPISFWLQNHIKGGRHHLNFSEWGDYSEKKANHKLEECYEMVADGEMPMSTYVWMHGEAALSDEQVKTLNSYFISLRGPDMTPEGDLSDHGLD